MSIKKILSAGTGILLGASGTGKSRIQEHVSNLVDAEEARVKSLQPEDRPRVSIVVIGAGGGVEYAMAQSLMMERMHSMDIPVLVVDNEETKAKLEELEEDVLRERVKRVMSDMNEPERVFIYDSLGAMPRCEEFRPVVKLHEIPNDFSKFRGTAKGHKRRGKRGKGW